jgi:hypothetical protein
MAVREFLDTEAGWKAEGSFENLASGAHTVVALIKPLVYNTSGVQWFATDVGPTLADGGSGRIAYFTPTEDARAGVGETANEWQTLAWTKAGGTVYPRGHRKVRGSGSWAHLNATGDLVTDKAGAASRFTVANFASVRVAWIAVFDTELSDSDIEAIDAIGTSQLLVDLGAVHLWEFNQASTATAVQDSVGSAHQTTISSGTVAVTGDDPPGWTFGVVVIPPLDFSVRLSGGSSNTAPPASIGGAESSTEVGVDLFDDVSNAQRLAGVVDYRLVYVHNEDVADGSVIAYVPTQLESGRELAVGVPTQLAGATVPPLTDDETTPTGVVFGTPSTAPAGLALDTIPAGSYRGLWLRRTVMSSTPQDPTNLATVKLEVSRVE